MTDVFGWNEGRLDHIAHEQATDPFGVLAVGLIALLWFCIFGV